MKTAEQLIEELDIQDLDTFMESAEFEQLDELSKETLASYIGKASKAYAKHDKQLGLADKANWEKISREDRQKYDKNVRKVSGNKGSLDTNDYDTHDSYHLGKLVKREKGISKAVGKLTKEEVEHDKEAYRKEAFKKLSDGSCTAGNNRACYMLGQNADRKGLSHKHNPYKPGTSSHKHWANGLEDAVKGVQRQPANFAEEVELEESKDNIWNARLKNDYGYGYESFNKGHPLTVIGHDKDHYIVKPFAVMHDGDQKIHKRNVEMLDKAVNKLTKESVEAFVSSILDGDQETAYDAFSQAMGEKISERMDSIKQDIALGL